MYMIVTIGIGTKKGGMQNTIKATIKNPLSNSTFDGYVNFII